MAKHGSGLTDLSKLGVSDRFAKKEAYVATENIEYALVDQSIAYSETVAINTDGTARVSTHRHDGGIGYSGTYGGCPLGHPLAMWIPFEGSMYKVRPEYPATPEWPTLNSANWDMRTDSSGDSYRKGITVLHIPFRAPPGVGQVEIHWFVTAELRKAFAIRVVPSNLDQSWTGEDVEMQPHVMPDGADVRLEGTFDLPKSTGHSGVIRITMMTFLETHVRGGHYRMGPLYLLPSTWKKRVDATPNCVEQDFLTGSSTPLVGSTFKFMDDTFTADNKPLSTYVAYNAAANDGHLHEVVCGGKAPRATSITATPHDHANTNSSTAKRGIALQHVLYNAGLGYIRDKTGTGWNGSAYVGNGGLRDTLAFRAATYNEQAVGGCAPTIGEEYDGVMTSGETASQYYILHRGQFYVPDFVNATRNGYLTVLCSSATVGTVGIRLRLRNDVSEATADYTYTTTLTASGTGFYYIDNQSFQYLQTNQINYFTLEAYYSNSGGTDSVSLLGLTIFTNQGV